MEPNRDTASSRREESLNCGNIKADHLKGLPGFCRAARDALMALQPPTVLEALLIPKVGRKTTRHLLQLGLITDPENVQKNSLYDAIKKLDPEHSKQILNKITKYLCNTE